ncbi:PspC domain-containing protein [Kineosporia succinea]|uniref:Phage shock protein PspC (Stress-responsive transcriptional regulator) n=1 Tax=Kineosporia succinea TaxID=84632 RepID=A0ABT9P171_9ACTN|nr:PspC domain-containing protein [Kineosporia succinea]MDP9825975.1 phage shock protein PspC (stress-responsive transcriptional regulator) [Kineosporia succinea]
MNTVHRNMYDQGLYRPRHGGMLGGVCAGLAKRFGIGATMMRLIFVITLFVIPGSQILVYPLLWLLMPKEQAYTSYQSPTSHPMS